MLKRLLAEQIHRSKQSALILGPRQVGKSTLIRVLSPDISINLADEEIFLQYAGNPALLRQRIAKEKPKTVFIDEVQRLPRLLNSLQALIDEGGLKFFLTGSSARKLRRGRANLLPGRLNTYQMGPLSLLELDAPFDEQRALSTGMLPGIYLDDDAKGRKKLLSSYASTYLREEVQAEALTRNIEGFARFLRFVATTSGLVTDQVKLAREALVSRSTIQRYLEILFDTLLAYQLDAFAKTERRRLVQHPKFYLFDVGVLNALLGSFDVSGDRTGTLLEHAFVTQLFATAAARDEDIRVSTYRTENGAEVDFIVEHARTTWAIELKASTQVASHDTRGLRSFADWHGKKHRAVIAYRGSTARQIDGIDVLPWPELIAEMFGE